MKKKLSKVILSLGSNLNNPVNNIKLAIEKISNLENVYIISQSSYYETTPLEYEDQPNFINLILIIKTSMDKFTLLQKTQSIEKLFKRQRNFKNCPRTLDIDIIDYNQEVLNSKNLILPHPKASERAFVLAPLQEIEPNFILNGKNINGLLKKISTQEIKIL